MTIGECHAYDRAAETVRQMGELVRQDWWIGWIAYLDQARARMPELLQPKSARKWPWLMQRSGRLLAFDARKRAKGGR